MFLVSILDGVNNVHHWLSNSELE